MLCITLDEKGNKVSEEEISDNVYPIGGFENTGDTFVKKLGDPRLIPEKEKEKPPVINVNSGTCIHTGKVYTLKEVLNAFLYETITYSNLKIILNNAKIHDHLNIDELKNKVMANRIEIDKMTGTLRFWFWNSESSPDLIIFCLVSDTPIRD